MKSNSHRGPTRRFPRTARLNESLREVLAETLESIDDDRLELVTITSVDTEADMRRAIVYYSALTTRHTPAEVAEALDEQRVRLQAALGRQLVMKRTPLLRFASDPAIANGQRIEDLLRSLPPVAPEPPEVDPLAVDQATGTDAER